MIFPSTWPADCPPKEAVEADGVVFRIVNYDPPIADDFASHFETGKLLKAPPCLRCGLSVFRDLRDVIHQRSLFPKIGRFIARGLLVREDGKTMLTAGRLPTHTTWWTYSGVVREANFSVVGEDA